MPILVDKHLLLGELSTGELYTVGHAMTLRKGSSKTSTKTNRRKVKLWQRKRYRRFHYNKQLIADLYLAAKYTSEQNQIGSGKRLYMFIRAKKSDVTAIHLTTHPPHILLNTQLWQTQGFSCLFAYLVSTKPMHSSPLQNPKDSKWTSQFFIWVPTPVILYTLWKTALILCNIPGTSHLLCQHVLFNDIFICFSTIQISLNCLGVFSIVQASARKTN